MGFVSITNVKGSLSVLLASRVMSVGLVLSAVVFTSKTSDLTFVPFSLRLTN